MSDMPIDFDQDAIRRQSAVVERIISRRFEPDQIDAPTVTPLAGRRA